MKISDTLTQFIIYVCQVMEPPGQPSDIDPRTDIPDISDIPDPTGLIYLIYPTYPTGPERVEENA